MRPALEGGSYGLRGEVVRMAKQVAYAEASVTDADLFRTPLGDVRTSAKARLLARLPGFSLEPDCQVERPPWAGHFPRPAPTRRKRARGPCRVNCGVSAGEHFIGGALQHHQGRKREAGQQRVKNDAESSPRQHVKSLRRFVIFASNLNFVFHFVCHRTFYLKPLVILLSRALS